MSMKPGNLARVLFGIAMAFPILGVLIFFSFIISPHPWSFRNSNSIRSQQGMKLAYGTTGIDSPEHPDGGDKPALAVPPLLLTTNKKQTNDPDHNPVAVDEQDAEFDREAKQLALEIQSAKPHIQGELREKLENLIDQHFEHRQAQRSQEIEQLSQRVDSLRVLQQRRKENKTEILKRRMSELLDRDSALDWTNPGIKSDATSGRTKKDEDSRTTNAEAQTELPTKKRSERQQREAETRLGGVQTELLKQARLSEPTFQGTSLKEWLDILETERSPEKLGNAVEALIYLAASAEPQTLVQKIIRMSRLRVISPPQGTPQFRAESQVTGSAVQLLCALPPKIVAEEFVSELDEFTSREPSPGFKLLFSGFIQEVAYGQQSASRSNRIEQSKSDKASVTGLRGELRRRSRRMVFQLVGIAQEDNSLDDWVLGNTRDILKLSEQPLTTYPVLIPLVERVFADTKSPVRISAADLLAQSGLDASEVLAFSEMELRDFSLTRNNEHELTRVTQRISGLLPAAPKEVLSIIEQQWKGYLVSRGNGESLRSLFKFQKLVAALRDVGELAKDAIPTLHTYEQSESCDAETRKIITDAIKQIEEAKPKPKADPLPDDAEIWRKTKSEYQADSSSIPSEGTTNEVKKTTPSLPPSPTTEEQTFDGIPYSQWLKMLETERKPEKLATAMEACSRLAAPGDERRIARLIFLAARLFESSTEIGQVIVWDAGWIGLRRLPPEAVFEELIAALRDESSYKSGHEFQGSFLSKIVGPVPDSLTEALRAQSIDIVAEIQKSVLRQDKGSKFLLAGASQVWRLSNRPLSDFHGLEQLLINVVAEDPAKDVRDLIGKTPVENQHVSNLWSIVAWNLVEQAPESPNLSLILARHAHEFDLALQWLGKMGHFAEPAVPILVDEFLIGWNKRESNLMTLPRVSRGGARNDNWEKSNDRLLQLIDAIGEIGIGAKGYALLRQLNTMMSSNRDQLAVNSFDDKLAQSVDSALRNYSAVADLASLPRLLNDGSMINGTWNRTSASSIELPDHLHSLAQIKDFRFRVFVNNRDNIIRQPTGYDELTAASIPRQFTLNESQFPRQITFPKSTLGRRSGGTTERVLEDDVIPERLGIYDLTESTLCIQLAKPGEPRPVEIVKDKASLPEGQLLLVFERAREGSSETTIKSE